MKITRRLYHSYIIFNISIYFWSATVNFIILFVKLIILAYISTTFWKTVARWLDILQNEHCMTCRHFGDIFKTLIKKNRQSAMLRFKFDLINILFYNLLTNTWENLTKHNDNGGQYWRRHLYCTKWLFISETSYTSILTA